MAKKKRGISVNIASEGEASNLAKLSKKELGKKQNSNPDEWDRTNIQALIDSYEKAYPGRLRRMKNEVDVETALSGRDNEFGVVSKDSDERAIMWMPADLQQVMEAAYPSIWTNEKHLYWFLNRFPIFRRAEKV